MKRIGSVGVLLISGIAVFAGTALAQSPLRRPVVSPYLHLLRPQSGVLPNYHAYVEPRIELQRTRALQVYTEQVFQQQLTRQQEAMYRGFSGQARPTGGSGAGGYMNYLHFYSRGGRP